MEGKRERGREKEGMVAKWEREEELRKGAGSSCRRRRRGKC